MPEASTFGKWFEAPGLSGGKLWECWTEDGILPPGEARGSGGGLIGNIWDALLDAGVDDWREGGKGPWAGAVG